MFASNTKRICHLHLHFSLSYRFEKCLIGKLVHDHKNKTFKHEVKQIKLYIAF